jgi:hypothetical protein
VRWTYRSGGKISGSPTIVGKTVYFSDLGRHRTYGLNTRTGHIVFLKPFGAFDPVISDGTRLFVGGARSLSAYVPRSAKRAVPKRARKPARHRAHARHAHPRKAKPHARKAKPHARKAKPHARKHQGRKHHRRKHQRRKRHRRKQ